MLKATRRSKKTTESPKKSSNSPTKSPTARNNLRILTPKSDDSQTSLNEATLSISTRANAGKNQVNHSPKAYSSSTKNKKRQTRTRSSGKTNPAKGHVSSAKNLLPSQESKSPQKNTETVTKKAQKSSPNRTNNLPYSQTSLKTTTLRVSERTRSNKLKKSPKASSGSEIESKGRSGTSTRGVLKSAAATEKRKTNPAGKHLKIPQKSAGLNLLSSPECSEKNTEKVAKKAPKRTLTRKLQDSENNPNGTNVSISEKPNARRNQVKEPPKASSSSEFEANEPKKSSNLDPKTTEEAPNSETSTIEAKLRISERSSARRKPVKESPQASGSSKIENKESARVAPKSAAAPKKRKTKSSKNPQKAKSKLKNEDIEEQVSPPKRRKCSTFQSEAFKRYGVIVPSIEEMLAEKSNLVSYKRHVEEAQMIAEPVFVWPTLPKPEPFSEPMLDCKNLTPDELTEQFKLNVGFLAGIHAGKSFSERHQRYHNASQWRHKFTLNDLTYNTSTIVFSFEQVDHLATLIDKRFPDQSKYVFQVLLPELCLKIFMNQHDMSKLQAKKYLDKRPVQ